MHVSRAEPSGVDGREVRKQSILALQYSCTVNIDQDLVNSEREMVRAALCEQRTHYATLLRHVQPALVCRFYYVLQVK